MRDPKRIAKVMELIQQIWSREPDLRFFQLVSWLEHEYSKENGGFGRLALIERDERGIEMPHPIVDLFHLEDGKFESFLKRFIETRV